MIIIWLELTSFWRWGGKKGKQHDIDKGPPILHILAEGDWVLESRQLERKYCFTSIFFCSFSGLTFPRALIFKTWTRNGINLKGLPLVTKSSSAARERWLTSTVDFLVMVGQGLPLHFLSCVANGESFPLGSTHPGAIFQGEIADRNSHWHKNISHRKTRWTG